ncbi:MAG: EAL domain-containing protein [Sulfurimicrobium sp.]|nr:EAL domain-containing protein [Sulfurimicrobium sp.]
MSKGALSLRAKLVLLSILIQVVMLSALAWNGDRLMQRSLVQQGELRLKDYALLLNTALSPALVEKDYSSLQEILSESRKNQGIVYLILRDMGGRVIAMDGWKRGDALPGLDSDFAVSVREAHPIFNTELPIRIAEQTYGTLRFGIDTRFIQEAQSQLLRESLLIAVAALAISSLLLTVIGLWLTRHLGRLNAASQAVAEGNFDITLPVKTRDEVGQLTTTFNTMASAVRARIEELGKKEARFHAIADYTYGWESWFAPDGKLLWVNPSVERVTGYPPEACLSMPEFPLPLIAQDDQDEARQKFSSALRGAAGNEFEFRLLRKDGAIIWVAASWQPIYDESGTRQGMRASIRDVTRLKKTERQLRDKIAELEQAQELQLRYLGQSQEEHARLTSLLSAMNFGILFVSQKDEIVYYNPAFIRTWMIPENLDLIGKPAIDVLNHSANVLARPDNFSKHVLRVTRTHEVSETFEISLADGRTVTQLSYPVHDQEGRFIGRLWIYEDITRERQTAEQLIYLAERDSLTGLYNRHRFQEDLSRMVSDAERRGSQLALLFFDLDEFKYINDTFGHRAGDAMLIRVAGETATVMRQNELLARLGGDEFAVLIADTSEKEAEALAERIVRAIAQIPLRFDGQNLRLTSSLGIAFYPLHANSTEELIAHADSAMYQAKEAGKNGWRTYRPELDDSRKMVNHLTWNDRISRAVEQGLLQLHFQGIYHTLDGSLAHLEALVRMTDVERPDQLIMPGHFIAHAEKNGKIRDIDRWVICECIRLLSGSEQIPSIAVNISGRSFDDPTLPRFISEQLALQGVAPKRLLVELTETSAVTDLHDAQRFIESLRQTGCQVCLDDFGTGFSSFAYLKHLNADVLKIDGLFIRNLTHDHDNQVFVKAIVDVARGMHKITVAEFVENADTLEMLKHFGVDMVQGYHLDTPKANHPALSISR